MSCWQSGSTVSCFLSQDGLLSLQEQQKSKKLEESMRKLDVEMRRTDQLLYQMIPKAVADRLRQGEPAMNTCQVCVCVSVCVVCAFVCWPNKGELKNTSVLVCDCLSAPDFLEDRRRQCRFPRGCGTALKLLLSWVFGSCKTLRHLFSGVRKCDDSLHRCRWLHQNLQPDQSDAGGRHAQLHVHEV